ncbi:MULTISPECIES: hypothetical protein [Nostocales]|uniref:Uncharacterized protein n=3 Tax=Nostocales TaxID=1161 RepID=A0A0C1NBC5_9CYAN|nr:hypothetical protein [Tolypothrix bouteillei]KAF3890624.1 hypothetical protein DA73_0400038135 [Tolypothrix bouteillei VB521301]
MSLILILLGLGGLYYFFLYPIQKVWQIKRLGVLRVPHSSVGSKHQHLKFGILYQVNWTELSPSVICITYNDGEYIFYTKETFNIRRVRVPVLSKLRTQDKIRLRGYQEIVPLVNEYFHLEEEIKKLCSQRDKIQKITTLMATSSDIYSNQLKVYQKSFSQIESLITKGKELQHFYHNFIGEILMSSEIAACEIDVLLDNDLKLNIQAIDAQFRRIKEEYRYLKDRETAYHNLLRDVGN